MSQESNTLHVIFESIFNEGDEATRNELIDQVLREHHTVFTHLSRQIIARFNINDDWADDVRQIVRTEAWRYLNSPLKPGYDAKATLPCIRIAARAEVQRMRQSSAYTGLSGAVSARRRESAISKHRMDLIRTLGYEPDDETLIESYNAKVTRSRSEQKARTQGALATKADLQLPVVGELGVNEDFAADSDQAQEAEVRAVLEEILRRCHDDSEQTGQVASVILGDSMVGRVGEIDWTPRNVVDRLHLSTSQVNRVLQRIRAIAVDVVDDWGLSQNA